MSPFNESILDAVGKLEEALHPTRIYLFGSCAAGTQDSSSDIDLLVVVPDDSEDRLVKTQKAYRATRGLPVARDIIVDHESVFEKRSKWVASIEREVLDNGKLIYGAQ